jgi:hypothetical protein
MAVTDDDIRWWLSVNPNATDAQIRAAMDKFGVSTSQLAQATDMQTAEVDRRYNAAPATSVETNWLTPDENVPSWQRLTPNTGAAFISNAYQEFIDQNGGNTEQNKAAATQYLQNLGLGDKINTAYDNFLQTRPWEALSSESSPLEVSNAYAAWLKSTGSQDTEATRNEAQWFLNDRGLSQDSINQSYDQFKTNEPQFNTDPGSTGDIAHQIKKNGQPLQDPTKYTPNPFLGQMANAMTNKVTENLNRNIMPGIRSAATATGGYGGSRQGVVESNVINDANQGLSNALAGMYMGDYNSQMGRNLQQYGMDQGYNMGLGNLFLGNRNSDQNFALGLGNLGLGFQNSNNAYELGAGNLALGNKNSDQNFALGAGNLDLGYQNSNNAYDLGAGNLALGNKNADQNFALGVGNLGLGIQNSNQNFYTQQRGQDLQQVGLGADIFSQGTEGMLDQGQGMYNLGLTAQQAPWQTLTGFANTSSPYTGYGSTTQDQSGSAGAGFLGGAIGGSQLYQMWK